MCSISVEAIHKKTATYENVLNPCDWFLFISSASGCIRIVASLVQIAAGAAFAGYKVIFSLMKEDMNEFYQCFHGISYSIHGAMNFLRGTIALYPGYNVLLLFYDAYVGRFQYSSEKIERKGFYPLNQCGI